MSLHPADDYTLFNVSDFTSTRDGLSEMMTAVLGFDCDYVRSYMSAEQMLFVVEIAKRAEDTEAWFPNGKWATIQAIEGRLKTVLDAAVKRKAQP